MLVLAVDTSGGTGSLAIARLQNRKVSDLLELQWEKRAVHSELATLKVSELLQQADTSLKDLTHIVVNTGPGSFTGIRVGMSLARGLAYSLQIPLLGLNSLENLALIHGRGQAHVFVALKAVQEFYYCAGYSISSNGLACTLPPQSAPSKDLERLSRTDIEHAKVLIESQTPGFTPQSLARGLIDLVAISDPPLSFLPWKSVEPLYIRGSEAEEKLKRGVLKPVKKT